MFSGKHLVTYGDYVGKMTSKPGYATHSKVFSMRVSLPLVQAFNLLLMKTEKISDKEVGEKCKLYGHNKSQ